MKNLDLVFENNEKMLMKFVNKIKPKNDETDVVKSLKKKETSLLKFFF